MTQHKRHVSGKCTILVLPPPPPTNYWGGISCLLSFLLMFFSTPLPFTLQKNLFVLLHRETWMMNKMECKNPALYNKPILIIFWDNLGERQEADLLFDKKRVHFVELLLQELNRHFEMIFPEAQSLNKYYNIIKTNFSGRRAEERSQKENKQESSPRRSVKLGVPSQYHERSPSENYS